MNKLNYEYIIILFNFIINWDEYFNFDFFQNYTKYLYIRTLTKIWNKKKYMATLLLIGGGIATALGLGGTLFGFGTAGVVAGTAAAATQAAIGNVAAGSIFATLTSLGMKGIIAGTAVGGGITTALGAIAALI